MQILQKNVCAPKGFLALGKTLGIKKSGKPDFAVIFSIVPANAASVYTSNKIKGAPLIITKKHLSDGKAQAISINSGIANVCTGKKGLKDAEDIAKYVGKELGIKSKDVLVASTGLIGAHLPMNKIKKGIRGIKKELNISNNVATAIMTTDKVKKEIAVKLDNFTIGAISKGSGMIHPNMSTMLCFITTDAKIPIKKLNRFLRNSVNKSFNMTSVDMDTSTSDMAIILANGLAGKVEDNKFQKALDFVCLEMAKKIVKDGEGATKLVEVVVKNALTELDAKKLARSIICSNLFKCALFGNDPNWGRIMCAMGNSGANFDPLSIEVHFGEQCLITNGVAVNFNRRKVKDIMSKDILRIVVNLKQGRQNAIAYGCDMSYGYIQINACYTT